MTKKKDTFILRSNLWHQVNMLPNEDAGILFKSILSYNYDGTTPEELEKSFGARLIFAGVKEENDSDREKWDEKCEKNRANAKRRYNKQSDANASNRMQSLTENEMAENGTMIYDSDSDSDIHPTHHPIVNNSVSVCENKTPAGAGESTHTRTQEGFEKLYKSFRHWYTKNCPELHKSDMRDVTPDDILSMYAYSAQNIDRIKAVFIEMNNKRDVTKKYHSLTQTFKVFYDQKYNQ